MDKRPDLDPRIVACVAEGSDAATALFVERYQHFVHDVIGHVLGLASPDIDDVAQETFWAAIRAIRGGRFDLNAPGRLKAWLGRIAQRRAFNVLRGRRRQVPQTQLDARLEDRVLVDAGPQPYEVLERREDLSRLHFAMSGLSEDHRRAIEGRLEDRPDAEVALEAGVDSKTIRTRYARALKRLAAEMGRRVLLFPTSITPIEMEAVSYANLNPICGAPTYDIVVLFTSDVCTGHLGSRR